ncbi:hypothetical protein Ahy_B06g084766 isoform A [Arachis hypogaea]|uniref:Uncharacterized protein n=1 Tax=Arachis hypogaea TaxID=3818 RepID=A0A444YSQ5_ARAHY|nr:hypothetical protein Ahy_B06g084766 isoform A [Arachis hypogaea]
MQEVIPNRTIQQPKNKNSLLTLTRQIEKAKIQFGRVRDTKIHDRSISDMIGVSCECETLNQLGGLTRHQQKVHLQGKHEELLEQEMGLGSLTCFQENHEMGKEIVWGLLPQFQANHEMVLNNLP